MKSTLNEIYIVPLTDFTIIIMYGVHHHSITEICYQRRSYLRRDLYEAALNMSNMSMMIHFKT